MPISMPMPCRPILTRPALAALPGLVALTLIASLPARPVHAASVAAPPARVVTCTPAQRDRLGVRLAPLAPSTDQGRWTLQGQVMLPPEAVRVLSAPMAALIEQVRVRKGDTVRAGQALLALQSPQLSELRRDHQQATLQLQLARQAAERDQALLAQGIVPAARAQASQAQLQMAQAAVQERARQLQMVGAQPQANLSGQLSVGAPGRGAVVEVMVQAGQRVEAGAPLVKFASDSPLDLALQAPIEAARRMRVGDRVTVAGCDQVARLSNINTLLDGDSQTVSVRARWPQPTSCVWPQQRVQAEIQLQPATGAGTSWLVPTAAVLRYEGRDIVFIARAADRYEALPVRIVSQRAATAEQPAVTQILLDAGKPLQATDQVVSQGAVALKGMLQGLGAE